jgi:ADP-heptose:LPS heptosyltransferase
MTQVLIIQPSSLGDVVHSLQVARSIQEQRPEVKFSWIVRDIFAPLVREAQAAERVYLFRRFGGVLAFWRLMREVRQREFDYVFDMQGLLRTGFMTQRTRAKKKIGRADAREGSALFYDQKISDPPAGRKSHVLEQMLQFCPVVGAKPELGSPLEFREVDSLQLRHLEGPGGTRPIVMFPNSRRADKCWGGFKPLTEVLLREDRRRKVVWAGSNYAPDKDAFRSDQFLNLTGNTSVVSLPALVRRAASVITNESGPMHLAAALGVPLLAIFGAADPQIYGPYPLRSPTNHVVQAPLGDLRLLTVKDVLARFRRREELAPAKLQ